MPEAAAVNVAAAALQSAADVNASQVPELSTQFSQSEYAAPVHCDSASHKPTVGQFYSLTAVHVWSFVLNAEPNDER